jgi:hypothetical protein
MRLMQIAPATPSMTNVSHKVSLCWKTACCGFQTGNSFSIPPTCADHAVVMLVARTFVDDQK